MLPLAQRISEGPRKIQILQIRYVDCNPGDVPSAAGPIPAGSSL